MRKKYEKTHNGGSSERNKHNCVMSGNCTGKRRYINCCHLG